MKRSRCLLVLALFAALGVTPAISSASAVGSGVHGSVRRGPIQPVCQAEAACTAPAPGVKLTFVRGTVVHRMRSGARGRYSIQLAPGKYDVRVAGAPFGFAPRSVTVRAGRMSMLNILIDTGIR
jgi:hypothetical protein